MGCVNSKRIARSTRSPVYARSAPAVDNGSSILESSKNQSGIWVFEHKEDSKRSSEDRNRDMKKSRKDSSTGKSSSSFKLGISHRYTEAEQNAAGWPSWLTTVAGEAIQGWIPLKAESFEKLEKIGQGTYSSVFRAREVESGKIVALKKVRFDNFQPESIRFMAREITILRRLDHPNIMKLEGLITSKISSSIYLVFEYMEHDLAGLISCPDVKFSESQVKCYMRQLLCGIEHCHLRGIMHRDIKVSNILVNNEGILKIADFGLANICITNSKQPMTSRVVTLWYRPPELLMGSTSYGVSVDLWSVGCVFAELFLGKPILKGRTEVEQLHKIFKLCGSPPDDFWKKSKLPHATMFKPQNNYESSLMERCKDIPVTAVDLIGTLLSIEPYKRGTASSALMSEYFNTRPYACDPSSLPKYPPNKEMDAKNREDARRKKTGSNKSRDTGSSKKQRWGRKVLQEPNSLYKSVPKEEMQSKSQLPPRDNSNAPLPKGKVGAGRRDPMKPSYDSISQTSNMMNAHGYSVSSSGPGQVSASSGFAWARTTRKDATSTLSDGSKSKISALDPSFAMGTYTLIKQDNEETNYGDYQTYGIVKHEAQKPQHHHLQQDLSDAYHSIDMPNSNTVQVYKAKDQVIDLSGSLISQSSKVDEYLQKNEVSSRRTSRKSRFARGTESCPFTIALPQLQNTP